jgi:glycosyltransferase involved in cell wall biosynthesis
VRVIFVIDSIGPGGTERSTVVLAPMLRELGVETTVITMKAAEHDLSNEATASGTSVVQLQEVGFWRQLRELRSILRRERPDVVHTALFSADQLGRLAAWGTGIPVISSMVSTPYDAARLGDPSVRRWRLRAAQILDGVTGRLLVDRFHAVSEGVKDANARSLRLPLDRIEVGERGRDVLALGERSTKRNAEVRAALGIAEDAPVLLNLGRQEYQKAQVDLVSAVSELLEAFPKLVVLIAGREGAASGALKLALEASPEVAKHVRVLGHRADVGDLLTAADVLVISSHLEGTSGVAIEAMALRTPIVSTDLKGLRGILDGERNAVLVRVGDPVSLASGIGRVLGSTELGDRLASQGFEDFNSRYTMEAAACRMRALYGSLSGESE